MVYTAGACLFLFSSINGRVRSSEERRGGSDTSLHVIARGAAGNGGASCINL